MIRSRNTHPLQKHETDISERNQMPAHPQRSCNAPEAFNGQPTYCLKVSDKK